MLRTVRIGYTAGARECDDGVFVVFAAGDLVETEGDAPKHAEGLLIYVANAIEAEQIAMKQATSSQEEFP